MLKKACITHTCLHMNVLYCAMLLGLLILRCILSDLLTTFTEMMYNSVLHYVISQVILCTITTETPEDAYWLNEDLRF